MSVLERVEAAWTEYKRLVDNNEADWDTLTCYHTVCWLRRMYFPEGKNVGYWIDDNPKAVVGSVEGGHNVLLVPEGDQVYLVDFWYDDVWGKMDGTFPHVLRMDDPRVQELYGDPNLWTYYLGLSLDDLLTHTG